MEHKESGLKWIPVPEWFPEKWFLWYPWIVLCSWAARMAAKQRKLTVERNT
jgi:hypothetical protein